MGIWNGKTALYHLILNTYETYWKILFSLVHKNSIYGTSHILLFLTIKEYHITVIMPKQIPRYWVWCWSSNRGIRYLGISAASNSVGVSHSHIRWRNSLSVYYVFGGDLDLAVTHQTYNYCLLTTTTTTSLDWCAMSPNHNKPSQLSSSIFATLSDIHSLQIYII